eukprot:scaffold446830_cov37-Prasinocladus_malaysianus.AAC.1
MPNADVKRFAWDWQRSNAVEVNFGDFALGKLRCPAGLCWAEVFIHEGAVGRWDPRGSQHLTALQA